jgi:aspartyl-tRNA(Asn)/glutamyl-tRNA(Gln) amidotransferase subunit A
MSDLAQTDAAALSRAYAAGECSPVEVVDSVLARIDRWEPHLNAFYRLHAGQAREAAVQSEARWREKRPLSPLDGVPVTVKENLDSKGDPTPSGTAAGDMRPKSVDSPVVARLHEAGAVILGKTVMPDYGMLSSGLSSLHGITRNPWRLDRNTSGSSSGAGAAGAAGYGPLHVGTDIGGSVRLPAAHCGLFGLKPSLGRIPVDPPYIGRCAGPMTRTVEDAALLLGAVARPDDRDHMSLPPDDRDYTAGLDGQSLTGLRIGLLTDMGVGLAVAAPVRAAAEAAARALADAGAVVEPVDSFLTAEMFDGIHRFFEARSYNDIVAMDDATRAKVLPFIVEWCTWRAAEFTGRDVMDAYTQVVSMRAAATRAVNAFDFLISPVSPILPYEAGLHCPGDDPRNALPHIAFTVAWNFGEQPAASLNWDHHEGLPVGVQIVGHRFDDAGVLRMARQLERLRPLQQAWPEPPAP